MASRNLPSSASKRFKPSDEELIQDFLLNKINGRPLPKHGTVLECQLYGIEKNPWQIWKENIGDSYDGKDLYFFTTLKRKSSRSKRMVRTIGLGSWEAEDIGKAILSTQTNKLIGMRKRYRFEKSHTNHDGAWILHEYIIDSSLLPNPSSENNYVLCRFRKNIYANKRKRVVLETEATDGDQPNANDDAGIGGSAEQSENGNERIEIQNEPTSQSDNNGDEKMDEIQQELITNPSENNGDEKMDGIQQELTNPSENNGDEIMVKAVETNNGIEQYCEEEGEDDDDNNHDDDNGDGNDNDNDESWAEAFARQLIEINKDWFIPNNDVPMIPNTFHHDLSPKRFKQNL
ncbi:hypothetical protein PIB30_050960 [Stylosanthes scabra]|uniref:NAC domain-containing protein n=1 Tax=Stylosanthes scabra TaxID=79078 RepID=A0ABU6WL65_9FABA|nr:hypothetical protein [Stylosanthes scabra]